MLRRNEKPSFVLKDFLMAEISFGLYIPAALFFLFFSSKDSSKEKKQRKRERKEKKKKKASSLCGLHLRHSFSVC